MGRRVLREIAEEVYGSNNVDRVIKSMDIIGDIAIIKIPDELLEGRFEFARRIIDKMPYIKVVLRQISPVSGTYRIRGYEYLAGEKRTITKYKEYGAIFKLDVEKVYFTPRLSKERWRIVNLISSGERIANMFAGVGPYTILIAKYRSIDIIHSIDINPIAIYYHLENNYLNKVHDKIILYRGDAAFIINRYIRNCVDRVIMPLPELALKYIKYALNALDQEGWMHIYLHVEYSKEGGIAEALDNAVKLVLNAIPKSWRVIDIKPNRVREVAKYTLQVCVDTYVKKTS